MPEIESQVKVLVDEIIDIELGNTNNKNIQEKIINIMEGGKNAFNKRKGIYKLWKSESIIS